MTSAATMRTRRRAVTVGLAIACATTTAAPSEETPSRSGSSVMEEVVTVGTRGKPRAAVDTAVPVDVFSAEEIARVGSSDLIDAVNAIVPSFNVRRYAIADGSSFVRPTELRGLDAHHALVFDRQATTSLRAAAPGRVRHPRPRPGQLAYLDSAFDWRRQSSRNGVLWLGTRAGIYQRAYVALMPGLRWLPTPGSNVERAAGHTRLSWTWSCLFQPDGWWLHQAFARR